MPQAHGGVEHAMDKSGFNYSDLITCNHKAHSSERPDVKAIVWGPYLSMK